MRSKYDLTTGSLSKKIFNLSLPMIIANSAQSLYNLADIYFVGKLGTNAVAAVSLSGMVLMMVWTVSIGLSIATQAMVSRYIGAEDYHNARMSVFSAYFWGIISGIFIAIAGYFGAEPIFQLLGASEAVMQIGVPYIQIMFVSIIFSVFMFTANAAFHGAGNSKIPMIIGLVGVALNIILDPLLIFGYGPFPQMDATGAAVATAIARFVVMIVITIMLFGREEIFRFKREDLRLDFSLVKATMRIGFPGAAQLGIRSLSYITFMRIASGFGTATIAAMGVVFRLNMFILLPTFALAAAVGSVVGQNLGAGNIERAKSAARGTSFATAIYLWITNFILIFAGMAILHVFLDDPESLHLAYMFLMCLTIGYCMSAFGIIYNGSMRGAGDTLVPLIVIIIAYFPLAVPFAYFLSKTSLGAGGVFIGYTAGMLLYSSLMTLYFRTNRWTRVKIKK